MWNGQFTSHWLSERKSRKEIIQRILGFGLGLSTGSRLRHNFRRISSANKHYRISTDRMRNLRSNISKWTLMKTPPTRITRSESIFQSQIPFGRLRVFSSKGVCSEASRPTRCTTMTSRGFAITTFPTAGDLGTAGVCGNDPGTNRSRLNIAEFADLTAADSTSHNICLLTVTHFSTDFFQT